MLSYAVNLCCSVQVCKEKVYRVANPEDYPSVWGFCRNIYGGWGTRQSWLGNGTWDITRLSTLPCTVASILSLAFIIVTFRIMTINTHIRYIFRSNRSFRNLINYQNACKVLSLVHFINNLVLREKYNKNYLEICTR